MNKTIFEKKTSIIEIIPLLRCLSPVIDYTSIHRLYIIAEAMLSMSGRISMLGISRWTENGGSYRTIQRFFYSKINWGKLRWLFIRKYLISFKNVILIVGDDVTVTKAGKKTYGMGRFFSSLYGKAVPSIGFLSLSLINVEGRKSYPVMMEQIVKEKSPIEKTKVITPRKRGRPKGSGNKNRKQVELSAYLQFVQTTLKNMLSIIGNELSLIYFVFDGAFGNNDSLQMVRQCGLHLISKLRFDSALFFPYSGEYSGRGRRKKYGNKVDYGKLPEKYLKSSSIEGNIQTHIYQMQLWHKLFADLLNIVIIEKTHLKTGKKRHIILFSSDLELAYDKLIEYYRLRFQIEFNFRDAKQYWGLEDFMNISKLAVYNAANLAMFMVNLSHVLLQQNSLIGLSMNDLKAWFRARKYVLDTFKLSQLNPDPILIQQTIYNVSSRGRVNPSVYLS